MKSTKYGRLSNWTREDEIAQWVWGIVAFILFVEFVTSW